MSSRLYLLTMAQVRFSTCVATSSNSSSTAEGGHTHHSGLIRVAETRGERARRHRHTRTVGELLLARRRPLEHVVWEEPLQGVIKRTESTVIWGLDTNVIVLQLLQDPARQ